jgi:hypothetical protein
LIHFQTKYLLFNIDMEPVCKVDSTAQSAATTHVMWGSGINREQLLQKISLLALLGGVRDGLRAHSLTTPFAVERVLTIEQEAEIAGNLAFLSRRRHDAKSVAAIGIEENETGQGMIVRLCVNGDTVSRVEEGLKEICGLLEEISQRRTFPQMRYYRHTHKLYREFRNPRYRSTPPESRRTGLFPYLSPAKVGPEVQLGIFLYHTTSPGFSNQGCG